MAHKDEIEEYINNSAIKMEFTKHFNADLVRVWDGLTDTEQLSKLVKTGPADVIENALREGVSAIQETK